MSYRLRYVPGTLAADRFPSITYPTPWNDGYPTRERAETVLAAMPDPARMEIFECEE